MIIVECYADEFLMKSMGFPRRQVKHEGGKGKVLENVRKNPNVVGIIDEDPESHSIQTWRDTSKREKVLQSNCW